MQKSSLHFVSCHRLAERSFFYKGRQFPVCARCTGLVIGYLVYPFMLFRLIEISLLMNVIFQLPMLIDGGTQAWSLRESNNTLRFLTGVLSGVGQAGIVIYLGRFLAQLVLK